MKIVSITNIIGTARDVHCPRGGFNSQRLLLASDGMGFSLSKTIIPVGEPQRWHYKRHMEANYCVSGYGILRDVATGEEHEIRPGVLYAVGPEDEHIFQALEEVVLICIFNPPLTGGEVHQEDGSYALAAFGTFGGA